MTTRRVTYFVASSLDGFIADPDGGVGWLFDDDDYGFTDFLPSVDTVLLGRATYEFMLAHDVRCYDGKENYVFSSTLDAAAFPEVTVVSGGAAPFVAALKEKDGGDIWLVGGGVLFRALLEEGLVDRITVALHPTLLGRGIPILADTGGQTTLRLTGSTPYASGLVALSYEVLR